MLQEKIILLALLFSPLNTIPINHRDPVLIHVIIQGMDNDPSTAGGSKES